MLVELAELEVEVVVLDIEVDDVVDALVVLEVVEDVDITVDEVDTAVEDDTVTVGAGAAPEASP